MKVSRGHFQRRNAPFGLRPSTTPRVNFVGKLGPPWAPPPSLPPRELSQKRSGNRAPASWRAPQRYGRVPSRMLRRSFVLVQMWRPEDRGLLPLREYRFSLTA